MTEIYVIIKVRYVASVRGDSSGLQNRPIDELKGLIFMQKQTNIQDVFLNTARRERIPVTVYLINGFQLRGVIKGFDNFVVLLEGEGRQQLIYKHALSTITPSRDIPIKLNCAEKDEVCPPETEL